MLPNFTAGQQVIGAQGAANSRRRYAADVVSETRKSELKSHQSQAPVYSSSNQQNETSLVGDTQVVARQRTQSDYSMAGPPNNNYRQSTGAIK